MFTPSFVFVLFFILSLTMVVVHGGDVKDTAQSMPGGYSVVPNLGDERVLRSVHFAVANLASSPYDFQDNDTASAHVVSAYQQVVAGMNYKFEIVLTEHDNDDVVLGGFRVDVYDQFGNLSVRKWGSEISQPEAEFMWKREQSKLVEKESN
jgi:Cystatin domain